MSEIRDIDTIKRIAKEGCGVIENCCDCPIWEECKLHYHEHIVKHGLNRVVSDYHISSLVAEIVLLNKTLNIYRQPCKN